MVFRLGAGRSRDLRRAVLLGSAVPLLPSPNPNPNPNPKPNPKPKPKPKPNPNQVPLLLCVVWAAVSSLLTLPALGAAAAASVTVDPLLAMLESPRRCVAASPCRKLGSGLGLGLELANPNPNPDPDPNPNPPNPNPDPTTTLTRCVAVPVAVLSVGAIGTTLIASYLAFSAFCTDATCTLLGRCTVDTVDIEPEP